MTAILESQGARPTGSAALKPVDLDYIRNVVVKLLETEEIETYLYVASSSAYLMCALFISFVLLSADRYYQSC